MILKRHYLKRVELCSQHLNQCFQCGAHTASQILICIFINKNQRPPLACACPLFTINIGIIDTYMYVSSYLSRQVALVKMEKFPIFKNSALDSDLDSRFCIGRAFT